MSVRAKFKCQSVTAENGGSCITLAPVVGGSPENDSFYKCTPGGSVVLNTINPDAVKQFEEGKEYYIDFTRVACWLMLALSLMAIGSPVEARGRRGGYQTSENQVAHEPGMAPIAKITFVDHRDRKVDGAAGYNADLVTDLPQAPEEKLHLTLITNDPPTQRDLEVAQWFKTDPRLVHFRLQSHWNWYPTSDPHYRERLLATYGNAAPLVMLQLPDNDGDGHSEAIFNARSGPDGRLPRTSGELADMINAAVQKRYAPPNFSHVAGAQQSAIIRESDCPDGSCTPPSLGPSQPVPQVTPTPPLEQGLQGLLVLLAIAAVLGCLLIAAIVAVVITFYAFRQPAADDSILPARSA